MQLLYPEYLWGLFALAIPIIIHLFNFRKFQRVYFSDIHLLKEVQLETKSKSKLKHLIILLLRLLAITALVLAFCQPYIPVNEEQTHSENVISIYVDNSHSMDSKGVNGFRLELAKEQALQLINGYGATDLFQIITNDFEGRHQRLYSKQEASQLVEEINPSFQSRNFSEIYVRQTDLLKNEPANKTIFWLSDFQTYTCDFDQIQPDSSTFVNCIPYANENSTNLYIDSIWFETPVRKSGQEDKVFAKVINLSPNELSFKIQLTVNGDNQAFVNYTIAPEEELTCEIPFTVHSNGIQQASLSLTDYPNATLIFDDTFDFSYSIRPITKVLHLYEGTYMNDSSGYFGVLYGKNADFYFKNQQIGSFDYSTLKTYDLVILSGINSISGGLQSELKDYYDNGGTLCLYPAQNSDLSSYNVLLSQLSQQAIGTKVIIENKGSHLASEHPIYQGIFDEIPKNMDLPVVKEYFPIKNQSFSTSTDLISMQSGSPFLTISHEGNGQLVLCTSPIDPALSNWVKHALFVPTMLRVAEFSQAQSRYAYTIGKDIQIAAPANLSAADEVIIEADDQSTSFIPEIKLTNQGNSFLVHDQIKKSGHYLIGVNGTEIKGVAYNYDRHESKMDFLSSEKLSEALSASKLNGSYNIIEGADSTNGLTLQSVVNGQKYWWHLIVAALIFLGLEVFVYRLFK